MTYWRLLESEWFGNGTNGEQRVFPPGTVLLMATDTGIYCVLHDPQWRRSVLFAQATALSPLEVLATA